MDPHVIFLGGLDFDYWSPFPSTDIIPFPMLMSAMKTPATVVNQQQLHPIFVRQSFVCRSCFSWSTRPVSSNPTRRLYTSYNPTSTPPPPPPPRSGFAYLGTRRLISLRGPDVAHYLQGVVTANVSPTTQHTSGFYTAFLNAQGRVLNDVFIYPDHGSSKWGWLIEVDAAEAEKLYKHIKRFKLRAKFDVRLVDESEMGVWSVWRGKERKDQGDSGAAWTSHTIGENIVPDSQEIGCADLRAPGMGRRLILPGGQKPEVEVETEESTEEVYRVRRYLKGVPEGQSEILREAALPQESNIDFMGGIDYRKGCYVGQELTIRTHHTGVIRKRILPVMIYGESEEMPKVLEYKPDIELDRPPAETSIARFNKKGRSAGKWISGVGNIGLGLCRLEIMTSTMVQGEAGGYKEGDEFKMEWSNESGTTKMVKVKAFVPPWHLTK
jgi:transferase CAF17, mitochondrial